ncbi:hypothetical protein LPJ66_006402, partial [Kickxella alabastrina]
MGQPRLRLVNKETENHDDVTPPVSPHDLPSTPVTASRPKRARKSEAHPDVTPAENVLTEAGIAAARIKEECLRLYQAIKEMEKDGEPACIPFNKLPPKKDYPDYYVEISRPVALDIIRSRITRNIYKSVADFVADVNLMCSNAQQYNMPGSEICELAEEIKSNVNKLFAASMPANVPPVASPTLHIKLKVREERTAQSNVVPGDIPTLRDNQNAPSQTVISAPKPKRKRTKDNAPDSAESDDVDDAAAARPDAAGLISTPTTLGSAIDELFQAIYDADLTQALRVLDTPGLPLNEHRKVVLKDQEVGSTANDNYTWAPMHAAACYGRLKVAQVLCDKGADIEAVDTMHKSTPLAWAAYTGRKRLAKYLVRSLKASVNARNAHGQLPIQIVLDPKNPKWAEFLMPTDGSKVDLPPPDEHESSPEPKKTPVKRPKARSSENLLAKSPSVTSPSASALILTPGSALQRANGQTAQPTVALLSPNPLVMASATSVVPSRTPGQQSPAPAALFPGPPIPQCIGGIGHQEVTHSKMTDAMKEIVAQLISFEDDEGTRLAEVFEDLPDRKEYPEYYEVIVHPMALNLVHSRIAVGYRSFDAFNYDMMWIFNNATFFNESDSQIYQDAVVLEKEYKRVCRQVLQKYGTPFDTSYNDAVALEGRYVNRITTGDNDIFVGDFIYIKSGTEMRIAMVTRLRMCGLNDRRKFIDGRWFLKPSDIPELAGQPVYPHQLFAGPIFDSHGVRGISGKCYILLPNVYARAYPQGYAAQDVFICDSLYDPGSGEGQAGTFKLIANWAHCFKTPLMKPPTFVTYITPFVPSRRPIELWNAVNLLPHQGLTMLNRDAARIHEQNQARARSQSQQAIVQQQQHQNQNQPQQSVADPNMARPPIQLSAPMAAPIQMNAHTGMHMNAQANMQVPMHMQQALQPSGNVAHMRPPSVQTPPPAANITQTYNHMAAQHQQNLSKLQAQLNQQENSIRHQAMEQLTQAQNLNPNYIGSAQHQALMKQQAQLIEQVQQAYFAQVTQHQQMYNQQ